MEAQKPLQRHEMGSQCTADGALQDFMIPPKWKEMAKIWPI